MDRLQTIVALRACGHHSWPQCAEIMGEPKEKIRSLYRHRPEGMKAGPCPVCAEIPEAERRNAWEEEGNHARGSVVSEGPLSLPEFLDLLRVDTDTWRVGDWGAKRWQVGAKIKKGRLRWTKGRLDGELAYKGLGKEDLWSTWAEFVRREPIPIEPVVSPVVCPKFWPAGPGVTWLEGTYRALLFADPHFGFERDLRTGKLTPFHDRRALDIAAYMVEKMEPDYVGILGDVLDLTMWTDRFARSPEFYWTTQPAILECHAWLRRLREAVPRAAIEIFEGNHDARMRSALESHLIEACHLQAADELELPPALSVPRLLALHKLGIGWVGEYPDGERYLGPLRLQHGGRSSSVPGGTARANAQKNDEDTAGGHVHRSEHVSRRAKARHGWRTVRSWCIPCLCHIDGRVPGSSLDSNWQQGLAVVDYTESRYNLAPFRIDDGWILAFGQTVRGEDYTAELREALPDWNW